MRIKLVQKIIDFLRGKRNISKKAFLVGAGKKNIHKTATIREGCVLQCGKIEHINIGENVQLNPNDVLYGNITIGKNSMVAPNCTIVSGFHDFIQTEVPMRFAGCINNKEVIIEEDVWIGANCTVISGAHIHKGAVIGAHSFVNSEIPEYAVAYGTPARVKKYRK